jgi:hypothetical protein
MSIEISLGRVTGWQSILGQEKIGAEAFSLPWKGVLGINHPFPSNFTSVFGKLAKLALPSCNLKPVSTTLSLS